MGAATEYLTAVWNDAEDVPEVIHVSRDLYEAYKNEMVTLQRAISRVCPERPRSPESLFFKSSVVKKVDKDGWWAVAKEV